MIFVHTMTYVDVYTYMLYTESDPVCTGPENTVFLEYEQLEYSCTISYNGRWAPTMVWRDSSNDVIESTDSGIEGSIVMHSISITATSKRNGDIDTCTTSFGHSLNPSPDINEATNIPDYKFAKDFPPVSVHCK